MDQDKLRISVGQRRKAGAHRFLSRPASDGRRGQSKARDDVPVRRLLVFPDHDLDQ
jgi:hypothetical protein